MKLKITLFILLLIAVFVGIQWNTWFGQVYEEPYTTPSDTITRIMMSLGEDVATQRNFSWRCDTVEKVHQFKLVEQGAEDTILVANKGTLVKSTGGKAVFYRAELKNLVQGKSYFYQISNSNYSTEWHNFSMGDTTSTFSFLYIGDVQDKTKGQGEGILKRIIEDNNQVDFLAFGGDMIERPLEKYWDIWFDAICQFPCQIPFVACTGNHEYNKGIIKKLDLRWTHYFPQPQNGPKNFLGRCSYMHYKNTLFVVLDTDGICEPFALHEQYAWVKDLMLKSNARWKIVMMHHPVESLRKERLNVACCYFFKPLFEECGVDLVLQGHDHGYGRMTPKDDSGNAHTPVYVISSCSHKSYTPTRFDVWDRMASFRKMYQMVSITPDSLVYKSYDVEKGLYDGVTINYATKLVKDQNINMPELLEPSENLLKKGGKELKKYQKNVEERERSRQ